MTPEQFESTFGHSPYDDPAPTPARPEERGADLAAIERLASKGAYFSHDPESYKLNRQVEEMVRTIRRLEAEGARREDDPCIYCGEPTESYAGNPSRWPLWFPEAAEPGVIKAHHAGCVIARLGERERLRGALERVVNITDQMHWFWMDQEFTGDVSPGYAKQRMDELLTEARAALAAPAPAGDDPVEQDAEDAAWAADFERIQEIEVRSIFEMPGDTPVADVRYAILQEVHALGYRQGVRAKLQAAWMGEKETK